MANTTLTTSLRVADYKQLAESALSTLKRDRDRQIISRRFGFGLAKKQTLEHIGKSFGITRERVRQIEKAALTRLRQSGTDERDQINEVLVEAIKAAGGIGSFEAIIELLEATEEDRPYLYFLAQLAPQIEVIEEDDHLHAALGLLPRFERAFVRALAEELTKTVKTIGKPAALARINTRMTSTVDLTTLDNIARINKRLAHFDARWGLAEWPEVNPRSIRDKTYLVLTRHGKPLHFSDIASHIRGLSDTNGKRDVTVQAVHNELIKDPRFILIGRGIYALAEWGYAPGTVADIIADVLRAQQPLHKDEIVKRVLSRRQVKTTTIILNLQEKEQFVRIAKATYALKDKK